MTEEEIKKRIQEIKNASGDEEVQHSKEDELREDFIKFISDNSSEYGNLAKLILSTNGLDFARWCA